MTTGTPPPPRAAVPRRSRLRTALPLGVGLWLVLEIWLLVLIADVAGGFTVFLLLLAGVVLGGVVVKRAGRRALRQLNQTLQASRAGEPPPDERPGGGNGLLMLAGLLLIIPGALSDAAGLLLLLPPVRALTARVARRAMRRRMMTAAMPGSWGDVFRQARMQQGDGKVVRGEVIRDDDPTHHPSSSADGPEGRSTDGRGRDQGPRPPLTP